LRCCANKKLLRQQETECRTSLRGAKRRSNLDQLEREEHQIASLPSQSRLIVSVQGGSATRPVMNSRGHAEMAVRSDRNLP
jgi:hypothetical protein